MPFAVGFCPLSLGSAFHRWVLPSIVGLFPSPLGSTVLCWAMPSTIGFYPLSSLGYALCHHWAMPFVIIGLCPPSSLGYARSLHSPPFSRRTPGRLHQTQPIQNAKFLALEWLELSGDFLVTFWCMLWTGESDGLSPNQQSNSTRNDQTAVESPMEVWQTPMDTKQTAFLISIIKEKYK